MQIIRQHGVNKATAIQKIDSYLDTLTKQKLPMGLKIENTQKKWKGNMVTFSFKVKKGFIGRTISGTIFVTEKNIELNAKLSRWLTFFANEEKIKEVVNKQLDKLFSL